MRIGIFGGSFDPIHSEHISLARQAIADLALDRLFVMPAANPPHKPWKTLTPDSNRLEMCRLAFSGEEKITVCDDHPRLPLQRQPWILPVLRRL